MGIIRDVWSLMAGFGEFEEGGIGCYWRDRKCIFVNLNAKREIGGYL